MEFELTDLKPAEAVFEISSKPEKKYILKKCTLADQIWMQETFGKERILQIFQNTEMGPICQLVYHLLKDKSDFKNYLELAECVETMEDKINMVKSLYATIGISQPILEGIEKGEIDVPKALSRLTK